MKAYRVIWEIDIFADTPEEAAQRAQRYQRNGTYVGVFDVTDENGKTTRVDLDDTEDDCA